MKRILTIMVVLAVLTAGAFAEESQKGSADLTLSFQKTKDAMYDIGWYSDYTSGIAVTSREFTAATQNDNYTAYIGLSIGYSEAAATVKLSLPLMTNSTDITTVGYTADIDVDPTGKLQRTSVAASKLSATKEAAPTAIGTMTGIKTSTVTGYLPVKFHLNQTDVAAATENASYSATVVASVWAE